MFVWTIPKNATSQETVLTVLTRTNRPVGSPVGLIRILVAGQTLWLITLTGEDTRVVLEALILDRVPTLITTNKVTRKMVD